MPCYVVELSDGGVMHACGDFGPPCTFCASWSDFLCDFPVGKGKTCDAHLCKKHGAEVAPNVHYCPGHFAEWQKFRDSGGVERELANVVPFKVEP